MRHILARSGVLGRRPSRHLERALLASSESRIASELRGAGERDPDAIALRLRGLRE